MPKVSVIIPVYKTEKYLRACVDSFLAQNFDDFELILVDDGSPDACPAICDAYAASDARVRAFHQQNGGQSAARKLGLSHARGDYALFADSDDTVMPNILSRLYGEACRHDADVVCAGLAQTGEHGSANITNGCAPGVYEGERLQKELLTRVLNTGVYKQFGILPALCIKLTKTELMQKALEPVDNDIRMGEDAAVTYPLLLRASRVAVIPDALYCYRYDEASVSHAYDARYFERTRKLLAYLETAFAPYPFMRPQMDSYATLMTMQGLDNQLRGGADMGASIRVVRAFVRMPVVRQCLVRMPPSALPKRERIYRLLLLLRLEGLLLRLRAFKAR